MTWKINEKQLRILLNFFDFLVYIVCKRFTKHKITNLKNEYHDKGRTDFFTNSF